MLCFTHICSEEYFFLYGKKHLLMLLKKKKKKRIWGFDYKQMLIYLWHANNHIRIVPGF